MKRPLTITTVTVDRVKRFLWLLLAYCIRYCIPIKTSRVICWSFSYKQYGCSPRYITEYALSNHPEDFEFFWVLQEGVDDSRIDKRIKIIRPNTFKYLIVLYSSKFIISNERNDNRRNYLIKKKGQKYIMTWHGPFALKKIEKDAETVLHPSYLRRAKYDSRMCDLMLSNSSFCTDLINRAFWYNGEILEQGIPRNDIFFGKERCDLARKGVAQWAKIDHIAEKTIVMYAPTFRDQMNVDQFCLNWTPLLDTLEHKYRKPVLLFLRMHPNVAHSINIDQLLSDNRIINMGVYPDMQELLCVSDVLITDYSSTMFDFALMNKVCYLYAPDVNQYNRGFYFDIRELPFSLAESEDELLSHINHFDETVYQKKIQTFKNEKLGIHESGHASKAVVEWMLSNL